MNEMVQNLSRLCWHCRRGTKELDHILLNYLKNDYTDASNQQQQLFVELLEQPDSKLLGYFLGNQLPDSTELADLVKQIRNLISV